VAAGLAWGTDVRTAIDRAARIDGDSDSVACLVGLFLGAVGGLDALPREFVDAVPAREKIEQLARACARVEQD
jgi:ADP-ribosylglycohydrolase